ncbi:MAG: hypothetical protein ACLP8S_15745 [Solirubrobacteraceae bacterium]
MPSLWWDWKQFELSPAADDIGEMLAGVAQQLRVAGFTGVAVSEDVHGFKGEFIAAVVYLLIGGRTFWQVTAVGGDGSEKEAQAELAAVQQAIDKVEFL